MNVFADFHARIIEAVKMLELTEVDFSRVVVEPPRDPSHGDLATNAAMVLAKAAGLKPRDLAERIAAQLNADPDIVATEVAGPGFLNLRLSAAFWQSHLRMILSEEMRFGSSKAGAGRKINVEYVSANPTGPMHVGHCRGAVVGDTLANLLSFAGFDVTREYYINDAGAQIDVLARSALLRYREALGEDIGTIPSGLYPGDYLVPVGVALADQFGSKLLKLDEDAAVEQIRSTVIDAMMAMIRRDLDALNVHHDVFFSERSLHADGETAIRAAINDLTLKGHVYKGVLPPPKGGNQEDWENREQVLFRSTEVGDDIDRPLMKSSGAYTYFAADVAYFKDKYDRGYDEMIYVLGADHGGYVKRLEAVAKAVSGGSAKLTVLLCQLVKLFREGEPVTMSKRSGDFVTLREVVDEVGRDPVRFMMLYRKNDAPLDFDFAKVTEQSKDNPVFYVQYASARCHSVFRQAKEQLELDTPDREQMMENLCRLESEDELKLIRKLAEFPRVVEMAALSHEPHRLAFYLHDLASVFHAHWNKGSENTNLRFVKVNDPLLTLGRLGLVQAVSDVLTSGLALVGAEAPQEMR